MRKVFRELSADNRRELFYRAVEYQGAKNGAQPHLDAEMWLRIKNYAGKTGV